MKRKLLLVALLVMAISCMLVFSASAEEMNPDYNKQYVKTMTQNMTSVELEDGTSVNLYDEQGYTLCYYWDDVSSASRKLLSVRTKDLTFNFSKTSLSSIYYGEEHLAGTAKAGRIVVLNLRGVKNGSNQDIMPQHCANGQALAEFLQAHPKVECVHYCGLPTDKYYEVAKKYMPNGSCGVIAFGLKGGRKAAETFMKHMKLGSIETHVADSRTCCLHPASATHRQMTDEQLEACGVGADLIRLSCGLENAEDLIADLAQAIEKA